MSCTGLLTDALSLQVNSPVAGPATVTKQLLLHLELVVTVESPLLPLPPCFFLLLEKIDAMVVAPLSLAVELEPKPPSASSSSAIAIIEESYGAVRKAFGS